MAVLVALTLVQVRDEEAPCAIVLGEADSVLVGAALGGVFAGGVRLPPGNGGYSVMFLPSCIGGF